MGRLRRWWSENLENRHTTTWVTHAIGTALPPFLLSLPLPEPYRLPGAALWAVAIAILFLDRERRDEEYKRRTNQWYMGGLQGVSGRVDKVGDLLGPLAVAVTYILAALLGAL